MRQGKTIGAFGLDLSPLFARSDELHALALKHCEQAEELRNRCSTPTFSAAS